MKVFISYSHKDKRYRTQLNTHLALLKREEVIEDYEDLLKKMEREKD